ncbi:hypothetical protein D0Q02_30925 [Micromonospora craniellae]|uniref:Uncharacterized protein n=1 Tax=Micromonospora craniellae TaxID=2294034 RepID=A0A372FQ54_9ACTN|nr:hypothetical protein D0Q02_30925 [Micromonospora craniellae]
MDHCVQSILIRAGSDVSTMIIALSDSAIRQSGVLLPSSLGLSEKLPSRGAWPPMPDLTPLVLPEQAGPRFSHAVIREYFVAIHIADLIIHKGRSVAAVEALNDLAEQAVSSASVRGIFELVVCAIDERDPSLAAAIALSPMAGPDTTLPLMLCVATPTMRSPEVVQSCARRCHQPNALELTRSLLSSPAPAAALGETYSEWVLSTLRTFGAAVWRDMLSHLEQTLDAEPVKSTETIS